MLIAKRITASLAYRGRKALGLEVPSSTPLDARLPAAEKPEPYRAGYSAYGEDILILSWFNHFSIDPSTIVYADVGAAHPWEINNTFLFYKLGAAGILVEPDPDQATVLREVRPRDTVVNVGAAFDESRSAKITRFTSRVFNTFSQEQVQLILEASKRWAPEQRQEIVDSVEVPLMTISEVLESFLDRKSIDFISIDVESKDLQVLAFLNLEIFRPLVICIEAQRDRTLCDAMLMPHGYIQLANTPDNFLFMLDPYGPAWVERAKRASP